MSKEQKQNLSEEEKLNNIRTLLNSLLVVISVMSTIAGILASVLNNTKPLKYVFVILCIILGIGIIVIAILSAKNEKKINVIKSKKDAELKDFGLLKNFISSSHKLILRSFTEDDIAGCVEDIKFFVNSLYDMSDKYIKPKYGYELDFHVRFMTKDYVNGIITIPVFDDNRPDRCPGSMHEFLNGGNPYCQPDKETITAKIYKTFEKSAGEPEICVISDTKKDERFHKTREKQDDRLRSMIVYPIMYASNLVGTLVLQCNKENFFNDHNKDLWKMILEVYVMCLGKEKDTLDKLVAKLKKPELIELGRENRPLYYYVQTKKK